MLKEGVRLDRVRGGRQKYRRLIDSPYGGVGGHLHLQQRKISLEGIVQYKNCALFKKSAIRLYGKKNGEARHQQSLWKYIGLGFPGKKFH